MSEIRPPAVVTPAGTRLDDSIVQSIERVVQSMPGKTLNLVVQVPVSENGQRMLKGQLFVNVGNGLSFATWIDHSLDVKASLGWGVSARWKF